MPILLAWGGAKRCVRERGSNHVCNEASYQLTPISTLWVVNDVSAVSSSIVVARLVVVRWQHKVEWRDPYEGEHAIVDRSILGTSWSGGRGGVCDLRTNNGGKEPEKARNPSRAPFHDKGCRETLVGPEIETSNLEVPLIRRTFALLAAFYDVPTSTFKQRCPTSAQKFPIMKKR